MVAATVFHVKTATAPDDPTYNIVPSDWNSGHTVSALLQPADFANSNGVTFGVAAGVVTASVAAAGGAQTGISGIAAVGGTATSGTVSFANSNGVSWGMNGQSMTATVKTDYQTSGAYLTTAALSQDSSKYAGTSTGMTGGSVTLNTSGIAINLPAYLTTAALSQDSSKYAGTSTGATNASVTLNTAGIAISIAAAPGQTSLSFVNSNGVTFGTNGSTLTASVQTNYLTTARASNDALGLNTAGTNITWTANSSGVSINNAGLAGTATTMAAGLSATLNSVGLNLSIGAYLTTADLSANSSNYARNWKLTGNSAGTQSSAIGTDLWLAGGQGITVSGSSNTISLSVGSYITTADLSQNSSKYAGINGAITGGSITVNTSGVSVNLPAYLTTADLSQNSSLYYQSVSLVGANTAGTTTFSGTRLNLSGGQGITLSGNASTIVFSVGSYITTARASTDAIGLNTAQTNVTWTVNSSGISFNAGGYAGTGTSATNASITMNSVGLAISVAAPAAGVALYDGANSISTGTARFTNANGVTFTFNGQTISASVNTSYRASNDAVGLNTAQTNVTWTVNSSGVSFNAGGYAGTGTSATNASITLNTNGLAISVAAPGGTISFYENIAGIANVTSMTFNSASISQLAVFQLQQPGSFSFLRLPVNFGTGSVANYSGSNNASFGGYFAYSTWNAVAYSMGTGASSQSLVSVASGSNGATFGISYSFSSGNSAWSVTQSYTAFAYGSAVGVSTQFSTTSASVGLSATLYSNFVGLRWLDINFANSLSAGPYWMIVGLSTSSTTSGTVQSAGITGLALTYRSHFGISQANSWFLGGGDTAGSSGVAMGAGSFSTAGGGTTSIIPTANISSFASNNRMYFQLVRSA